MHQYQGGQGMIEYLLLSAVILTAAMIVARLLPSELPVLLQSPAVCEPVVGPEAVYDPRVDRYRHRQTGRFIPAPDCP